MQNWLVSMLSDNSGGISTMRVCILMWILVVCFNITYGNIVGRPFPITGELVAMTAVLAGAKAVQRFGEKTEITFDNSTNQVTNVGGVPVSQLPLTVTVQGSVPVSGQVPIAAQPAPPTTVVIQPPTPPVPTVPPVVQPPTGTGVSIP